MRHVEWVRMLGIVLNAKVIGKKSLTCDTSCPVLFRRMNTSMVAMDCPTCRSNAKR